MQVIPCGWTNPEAVCIIGRGMLLDLRQLSIELQSILPEVGLDFLTRFIIDERTGILSPDHHNEEGGVHGELHKRIGSTGEGVGAARIARIRRDPEKFQFAKDMQGAVIAEYCGRTIRLGDVLGKDTHKMIAAIRYKGDNILLEGAQGSGLSLIHGPWPYVTTADTNAAQLAADIGLPPHWVNRVLLVARTYPIRVAGNSGPLKGEKTWEEMSRSLGKAVEEKTTVTKKVRRIGAWDTDLFMEAVALNGPTSIALTFADYLDPRCEGMSEFQQLTHPVRMFINTLSSLAQAPVQMIGTGGHKWNVIDMTQTNGQDL